MKCPFRTITETKPNHYTGGTTITAAEEAAERDKNNDKP